MFDSFSYPTVIIRKPRKTAIPLIVSSPHSGRKYFSDFLQGARLPLRELQRSEDRFTDLLFEKAPDMGATFISTEFPRVWCDVNRDFREIDAGMFRPSPSPASVQVTDKVRFGIGVIPRCASQGRPIYTHCLPFDEIDRRLTVAWYPYHAALTDVIDEMLGRFGVVFLMDVHSMPRRQDARPCDTVLGDCHGKSCASGFMHLAEETLKGLGYAVKRNVPYAGGYITRHYGQPMRGVHALQLEVCRSRYLNANTLEPSRDFRTVQNDMERFLSVWPQFLADWQENISSLAAE